jgi:hypothetical protein
MSVGFGGRVARVYAHLYAVMTMSFFCLICHLKSCIMATLARIFVGVLIVC